MKVTVDLAWEVVPHTEEKVLRNKYTTQIVEFDDTHHAPEQEMPLVGLADFFSEEDRPRLAAKYTKYQLLSGGF